MALSVPSRFAVLKIEDDDFKPSNSKPKDKKKNDQKQNNKKTDKQVPNKKAAKQSKPVQQKKERKKKDSSEQWEQWKQKDSELVDGSFEQDLHNAILLSKLDFEEQRDLCKLQEKKTTETQQTKKKKNKAMSLEQFNSLVTNAEGGRLKGEECNGVQKSSQLNDNQFFERIRTETKEELKKELKKPIKKDRKSFNNDTITIAQLQEKLEVLQVENTQLRADLDKSKKEIVTVKTRNKILCGMLASGEMKDKADILMEVEKLNRVKDELTEEITKLNGLLEQERSKVGALTAEPHTHNHKKEKNYRKKAK